MVVILQTFHPTGACHVYWRGFVSGCLKLHAVGQVCDPVQLTMVVGWLAILSTPHISPDNTHLLASIQDACVPSSEMLISEQQMQAVPGMRKDL